MTDLAGFPLEGAVVSVGTRFAETASDGSFALTDLPADATGPITATASGHTAWTLDTATLTGFSTRLRPRAREAAVGYVQFALTLPPSPVDRVLWLSSDDGRVVDALVPTGAERVSGTVPLTPGRRVVAAFAPSSAGVPALALAPRVVVVGETSSAMLAGALLPTQGDVVSIGIQPSPAIAGPVTVRCSFAGAELVVGRGTSQPGRRDIQLEILGGPDGSCSVLAEYDLDVGFGPVRHVAFVTDRKIGNLGDAIVRFPPESVLGPGSAEAVFWEMAAEADVYDVFLAPDQGGEAGPPVWSATTERTSLSLPLLPEAALDRIDDPEEPLLVRVVARYAPALDIEDNWDWSTYHAYVASPWLPVSRATLERWGR